MPPFNFLHMGNAQPHPAPPDPGQITQLLAQWGAGDRTVEGRLFELVYGELRSIAGRVRFQDGDETLNATSLVHEAYLRLRNQDRVTWQNRSHFFAIAAKAMRRILISYAARKKAGKRGGGAPHDPLHRVAELITDTRPEAWVALDEALTQLEAIQPRWSQVVEYSYFCGLTLDQIAEVLGVSRTTVKRDLRFARHWLKLDLDESTAP